MKPENLIIENLMKYIVALVSLLGMLPLSAQEVQRIQVGNNQDYGITYQLPATQLLVHAEAVCTQVKAGVFAQYAEKYLGITDAPMEDLTTWEISSVQLTAKAVADSARTYHVNFNEKLPMPVFYLNQGMLLSINRQPSQTEPEMVAAEEVAADKSELHATQVMNEELLKAGSKAKQAEIAARQIFRIRESRLNLLTGEVDNLPADGASFQLVLDNLQAQESAYMELFVGVKTVTSAQRDFVYRPVGEGNTVLFRFSKHFGFVDADDLSGEPYKLAVTVTEDKRTVPVLLDAKGKPKPMGTGIAYTVPGRAHVTLSYKNQKLAQGDWQMGQFGHVEFLSSLHFTNKKAPASAQFDPMTGAITLYQE